jgi:hypothetical protein
MVENGALGYAEHVPDAVEVGLVLVLHALEPFIDDDHSFLNGLHLQLHERRNALVQRSIVDLLLDSIAFLVHQLMHLGEGHIFSELLHTRPCLFLHHTALDLLEDSIVILNQIFEFVLELKVNELYDRILDLFDQFRKDFTCLSWSIDLRAYFHYKLTILEKFANDVVGIFALHSFI